MNWDAIGAMAELFGALAVLATLIYLSLQIKMSSMTQRAQTHQQMASDRTQGLLMVIENKELRDAITKGARGIELSENEDQILYWFTIVNIRAYENELYQHSKGMIDDEELEVQRSLLELPYMKIEAVVRGTLSVFTPRAQSELKVLVEKRKGAT
jgi:hypothetical protein